MSTRLAALAILLVLGVACQRPPPPERYDAGSLPQEPDFGPDEEDETGTNTGVDTEDDTIPGDCVPRPATEREPSAAESAATFTDLGLDSYFGCAGCHANGSPEQSGMGWGPGGGSWHDASIALMEREPANTAVTSSSLYLHFTPLDNSHPGVTGATDAVLSWWSFRTSPITEPAVTCDGTDVTPEEEEDDEEPPVVCTPQPVSESASRQKWNELSMSSKFSCAGCHAALGTPDGRNQEWGPGDADWWTAATTLVEKQAVLEAEATSLYLHFTFDYSMHHEDGTAAERADTLEWILFHRSGELPAGCE